MLPYQQAHFDALIKYNFEGTSYWPYLDTHKPNPLITIGIGCATSLGEMLKLGKNPDGTGSSAFRIGSELGPAATNAQITAGYNRVMAMPGAQWYTHYCYGKGDQVNGCLWLPLPAIQNLVESRYHAYVPFLHKDFPNFDNLPLGVQTACLDLIWGYGPGGLVHVKPQFITAVNAGNFKLAATLSAEGGAAYAKRDAWRFSLFPVQ